MHVIQVLVMMSYDGEIEHLSKALSERVKQAISGRETRFVLSVDLQDECDVISLSLHTPDIVFRNLDGHRILVADRSDLGRYVDYSNDVCCAWKAIYGATPRTRVRYAGRSRFGLL